MTTSGTLRIWREPSQADRLRNYRVRLDGKRGRARDLRVGLYHGALCLACCWGLIVLLVAFGLMNLAAMTALATIVLVEKTSPWGSRFSRALDVAALVLAVIVIFQPNVAPGLHVSTTPGTGRL